MFQISDPGATASTVQSAETQSAETQSAETQPAKTPTPNYEIVRHMLFGSLNAVENTIQLLYKLNYAAPNDWSDRMPTGRPNEVMAILTKRVRSAEFLVLSS